MEDSRQTSLSSLPKRKPEKCPSPFKTINLQTNLFRIHFPKLIHLYIFSIKILPQIDQQMPEIREKIISEILPDIKAIIHAPIIRKNLIFTTQPPQTQDKIIEHQNYIILLRQIHSFESKKNPTLLFNFFSNSIRKMLENENYTQIGSTRKFIKLSSKKQYKNNFIFTGCISRCVRLSCDEYYLHVDIIRKIVRNETVLDYINEIYRGFKCLERSEIRKMVKENLVEKTVMTNYGVTRYIKIEDVVFEDLEEVLIGDESMKIVQYYKQKYGVEIKNLKQPLLIGDIKNTKLSKTYLIPQLCLMTGIPHNIPQPDFLILEKQSRKSAQDRKKQIEDHIAQTYLKNADSILQQLEIQIEPHCSKIQAKIIPTPKILIFNDKTLQIKQTGNFEVSGFPIYNNEKVIKLAIIAYNSSADLHNISHYFQKMGKVFNVKIVVNILKTNNGSYNSVQNVEKLEGLIKLAKEKYAVNFCLILLSSKNKVYAEIKKMIMFKFEISCQVLTEKALKKKTVSSIFLMCFVQVLFKAGNVVWTSKPRCTNRSRVMVVGFYNSTVNIFRKKEHLISICAICNDSYTKPFSQIKAIKGSCEVYQKMKQLLLQALIYYNKINGFLPQDIIILERMYSEDKYSSCCQYFVKPVIKNMASLFHIDSNSSITHPKLIYLFLSRCKNDRYFYQSLNQYRNPPLGALITKNDKQDSFEIASHEINQGCSVVYKYTIIYSDSDMRKEQLQQILFSQCFNYANWLGSIPVPNVLYYAKKCSQFHEIVLNGDKSRQISEEFRELYYYI